MFDRGEQSKLLIDYIKNKKKRMGEKPLLKAHLLKEYHYYILVF
jgi:hypothetical protein